MSRAVFIGGLGNGQYLADNVGNALTHGYFEDADVFTFTDAMKKPDHVRTVTQSADLLLTHSAGILATAGAKPAEVIAVGAPLPRSLPQLAGGFIAKSARLIEWCDDYDQGSMKVAKYFGSGTAELIRHPFANIGKIGEISVTNSIELAGSFTSEGIPTTLFYNEHDLFFQPSHTDEIQALELKVAIDIISGQHDTLPLSPEDSLPHILR